MDRHEITGLVLAGGRARRFDEQGRVDKGLLELEGQVLARRCVGRLAPQVGEILISANRNLHAYSGWGRVYPDRAALGDCQGPLAGLLSVLEHTETEWALATPVDLPFLPLDLGERLARALRESGAAMAYVQAERTHPLCLLLRQDACDPLQRYLQGGGRKVMDWLAGMQALAVDCRDAGPWAFFNINTPHDLDCARARMRPDAD